MNALQRDARLTNTAGRHTKTFALPLLRQIFVWASELTMAVCNAPTEGYEKLAMALTRATRLPRWAALILDSAALATSSTDAVQRSTHNI